MRIGFIGTGNMGTAIIKGYLAVHQGENKNFSAYDKDTDKLNTLTDELGINGCGSLEQLMEQSDAIVLALKPNIFDIVVPEISAFYRPGQVLVSIAAGVSMSYIEKLMQKDGVKIIRVMPNTPAMVNTGMSALCRNQSVTDMEFEQVMELFRSVGKVEIVEEEHFHTVTGISSSPAYTYMYIEALINAVVDLGINAEQAKIFVGQSVLGAAKMVLETGIDPVTLRVNVCSPGGTTIEGVKVLQDSGFHDIIVEALNASVNKSRLMTK
jgi:pyrroline-5-carboxylate reductase